LFARRWNESFKREIRQSRIETTKKLVDAIAAAAAQATRSSERLRGRHLRRTAASAC
jgi:NAD dependent epimerase/dehydratase family enzyme